MLPALIRRHKYGLDQSLSHALAECLSDPLPIDGADYDVIMPVPLHRARLRWRGFNQAALLGNAIARRLERPLDAGSLVRVRETDPQTGKTMRERRSEYPQCLCDQAAGPHREPAHLAGRRRDDDRRDG